MPPLPRGYFWPKEGFWGFVGDDAHSFGGKYPKCGGAMRGSVAMSFSRPRVSIDDGEIRWVLVI
jgi:hypothetical protein